MKQLACVLLLVLGPGLVACGGEESSPAGTTGPGTAAETTPEGPLTFVDGLAAAAAKAKSPDDLVFVFVGRDHPT